MTKELMKKVIEAGIVPAQSIKLMKFWQCLDADLPDEARRALTQEQLVDFVEEISELLSESEEIPEMQETLPDLPRMFDLQQKTAVVRCQSQDGRRALLYTVSAVEDPMGNLIFPQRNWHEQAATKVGNEVLWDGRWYVITNMIQFYQGANPSFMRCEMRGIPHAEMSCLPEYSEECRPREGREDPCLHEVPKAENDQGENDG